MLAGIKNEIFGWKNWKNLKNLLHNEQNFSLRISELEKFSVLNEKSSIKCELQL